MKIRLDFVSNSSSSSYLCEVCGEIEFGFDASKEELGMCSCSRGHTFCIEHKIPLTIPYDKDTFLTDVEKLNAFKKELFDYFHSQYARSCKEGLVPYYDEDDKQQYFTQEEYNALSAEDFIYHYEDRFEELERESFSFSTQCPICQLKAIKPDELKKFLLRLCCSTEEEIIKMIQDKFIDYDEFLKYLSGAK